jgi:hypothetical protein
MDIDTCLYKLICDRLWAEIEAELQQEDFYCARAFFGLPPEESNQFVSSNHHRLRVFTSSLNYLLTYREEEEHSFLEVKFFWHSNSKVCYELIREITQTIKADTLILIYQAVYSEEKQFNLEEAFTRRIQSETETEEILCVWVQSKQASWFSTTPIFKMDECVFLPDEPEPFVYFQQSLESIQEILSS